MKKILRFAVCFALCAALLTANICIASAADGFYSSVEMLTIKNHIEDDVDLSPYSTVQGACSDGKYAYFAVMNGGTAVVAKYDVNTWEFVEEKSIINMGHSNDMTYNSDKDYLVVANNAPYYDVITLIDPDTLEPIKDVEIDEDIYSIAYNASRKQYVVGISGSYDFALLDSDFKVVKEYDGKKTGYTRQGCDCDDDYIYFVQSGGSNVLVVYDYSGKYVDTIPMTDSDEVENIFHIGNTYYVSLFYYGNTLMRVGFSGSSAIAYKVSYDANGGEGEMDSTRVHYGVTTPIKKCEFTREGYFFDGWRVQRDSDDKYIGYRFGSKEYEWLSEGEIDRYLLYDDEEPVAETVTHGNVKLYASWVNERYAIDFAAGEGEGEMESREVAYNEEYTIPESAFTKEEFVFDGYLATRECDGRTYGYRKNSDQPEWLRPDDVEKPHLFRPGDKVHSMTYDGRVTLTAKFKFAYTFGGDGTTLVEYVGVDEKVVIPANHGELKTLAQGAIKDNETMTELYIPAGVSSLQKQAVSNCPNLRSIYFEGDLPEEIDAGCISGGQASFVYEIIDDQPFCIGIIADDASIPLIRTHEAMLKRNYQIAFPDKSE